MHCYKLKFQAPFHVDSRGTGFFQRSDAFIRSDTLSAAILSTWATLEPQGAEARAMEPPFLLSSAFPFWQETFFLPRPLFTRCVTDIPNERFPEHKSIKKIRWLSLKLWHDIVQGKKTLANELRGRNHEHHPELAGKQDENLPASSLWRQEERTRLTVDRNRQQAAEGQLFDFTRTQFHPEGGLFFLVEMDPDHVTDFEWVLRILGDSGIGADRNVGNGWFTWEKGPDLGLQPTGDDGKNLSCLLSLVLPGDSDWQHSDWLEGATYDLTIRSGWVSGSSQRKKPLRMFVEGSQFKRPLLGSVVEVLAAQHKVYRDGRGFFVQGGRAS